MRAQLHSFIIANWYGQSRLTLLLLPLAWLFGVITWLRRLAYQREWLEVPTSPVPVIVVGNISVGGTGKTPVVAWLTQQLIAQGLKPGIVSRGYGARGLKEPVFVRGEMDPLLVGDEPVMLARQTGAPICVCPDRVAAVQALAATGVDVIIADDGLQHYRLRRAMEIVVIDGERGLGNRYLLPVGPLRESPVRLEQVDFVLINSAVTAAATDNLINGCEFNLQYGCLRALTGDAECELSEFAGRRVWMVAGIGNPDRFARILRAASIQVDWVTIPDHGHVSLAQLRKQQSQPILMTEKDAVKYTALTIEDCWYLPVQAQFAVEDHEQILECVQNVMQK